MALIIQERFPTFGAVVTTSASVSQAMQAIGNAVIETEQLTPSTSHEYSFRFRNYLWKTPVIRVRVAPSVAGTNVYVRVADEGIWRVLHGTLLLVGLGGAGFSLFSGEALPASAIALGALCVSVCSMWWIGNCAIGLVREALPE